MDETYYDDMDFFSEQDRQRLSRMLMLSRAESGLSQEKVALELGIAKKTVQNWERGVSMPTLPQAIAWFRVMKVAAMPYFLQFMYPNIEGTKSGLSDIEIEKQLLTIIEHLPPEGIRQLMYLFYGNHGSSPRVVMNLITAYLQFPLRERYLIDKMILSSYELAKEQNSLTKEEHIQPNTELVKKALEKEHEAILENRESYMII